MKVILTDETDLNAVSIEMTNEIISGVINGLEQLKEKNRGKGHFEVTLDVIINIRDTKLIDQ